MRLPMHAPATPGRPAEGRPAEGRRFRWAAAPLLLALSALTVAGCDSVTDLDETAATFISPDRFYQNDAQARIAVNAVYEPLMGWTGWRQPAQHSIMCDDDEMACESWMGGGVNGNIAGQWYGDGNSVWFGDYTMIERANQVIEYVGASAGVTPAAKEIAIAQARFARAYAYFDLVRRFGGVPIRTESYKPDAQLGAIARAPADSVWQQITTDLWAAAPALPTAFDATNGSGLPRAASAWGLLAKVYLHMAGAEAAGTPLAQRRAAFLDSAVIAAQRVMQDPSVALEARYMDLFDPARQNASREILFAVQGNRGAGSNVPPMFSPAGDCTLVGGCGPAGPGFVTMRPDFVATFAPNDKRWEPQVATPRAWTSMPASQSSYRNATRPVIHRDSIGVLLANGVVTDTTFITGDGWTQECNATRLNPGWYQVTMRSGPGAAQTSIDTIAIPRTYYTLKYVDRGHSGSEYGNANNFVVLRYADVLLVLAEAENERNGGSALAHQAVNLVRTRAGLPALAGLSQAALRDSIRMERRHELYAEFQRRFDLVRYGTYLDEMNKRVTTEFGSNVCRPRQRFQLLQPIPSGELAANPLMTQNPGY